MKFTGILIVVVTAIAGFVPYIHGQESSSQGNNLALFAFDDHSLPWRDNLKLTLERPRKYSGNPVLSGGDPDGPDGYGTALYGTVLYERGKFRMWYLAWPRPQASYANDRENPERCRPIAYAESEDGIHWTKPNLGLVKYRGSKKNNLVLIEPESEQYSLPFDFNCVLHDSDEPDPSRRYKLAYITFEKDHKSVTTATAVSADGLRWKLANTSSFTRGHFENTSLIRFGGSYYASGQNLYPFGGALPDGTPAGRVMTVFRSPDFEHWLPERSLAFYRSDYAPAPQNQGQEVHMGAGLWNRGNVILGLYGRWYGDTLHSKPGAFSTGLHIDLGFILSNDAVHYREPVRNFVMVPRGEQGEWDSSAILQANAFYNSETETYIWYSHWPTGDPSRPPLTIPANSNQAIGLLKLPRDRFGYLSKSVNGPSSGNGKRWQYDQGGVVSRVIELSRSARLYVNVDNIAKEAPLVVDLIDGKDRILPGYLAAIQSNSLKGLVSWNGKAALPIAEPFRIRIRWPGGSADPHLYALYVESR